MIETPIQDWNVVVAILFSLMAVLLLSVFLFIKVQVFLVSRKRKKFAKQINKNHNSMEGENNE